jgi:hypothetical protein
MRILTLFVRHGSVDYPTAVDDLANLFARQMPSAQWDLVIIDNTLPEDHREELGPNRTLIGGSNAQWEFSSWDNGIAYLGERLAQYDLVNLATAAFGKMDAYYLSQIDAAMLQLAFHTESIAAWGLNLVDRYVFGHINYYSDPVRIFGYSFQPWLETSFLFLPPAELKELGSLVSVTCQSGLFSGDPASPFALDAPLSASFNQYLLDSLTNHGTVPAEKLEWFQGKVVRLLNEHMLNVRLAAQGCAMIDGSWLASRADVLLPLGDPLAYIPKWHGQVATTGIQLPFVEDSSAA